jgi:hypothetical protein
MAWLDSFGRPEDDTENFKSVERERARSISSDQRRLVYSRIVGLTRSMSA